MCLLNKFNAYLQPHAHTAEMCVWIPITPNRYNRVYLQSTKLQRIQSHIILQGPIQAQLNGFR